MVKPAPPSAPSRHARGKSTGYWPRTLRLSAVLLLLWFLTTLGVGWLGPALDFGFFGWPFGLWATAQGALVVYCLIVWYYAWAMNRIDRAQGDLSDD